MSVESFTFLFVQHLMGMPRIAIQTALSNPQYDNIIISVMLVLAFVGKMANPLKEVVSNPLSTT